MSKKMKVMVNAILLTLGAVSVTYATNTSASLLDNKKPIQQQVQKDPCCPGPCCPDMAGGPPPEPAQQTTGS